MERSALHLTRAATAAILVSFAAIPTHAATVEVTVTNVHNARGHVHVELCPEKLWLGDCTLVGEAPARLDATVVRVEHVPPGTYAAQVFQDENDNHKVDRGLFGIPREPIGFSNDAPLRRRGPSFEDARFRVAKSVERITLRLRHLL